MTLERALAEHELSDSRYAAMASRIGRIEAVMIWFEERQDQAKERMDVALDDVAWEKRMTGYSWTSWLYVRSTWRKLRTT